MTTEDLKTIVGITVHNKDGEITMQAASITEFRHRCFVEGWPQTGIAIITLKDGKHKWAAVPELNSLIDEANVDAAEEAAMCEPEPDWDELEANAYGSAYGRSTPIVEVDTDGQVLF